MEQIGFGLTALCILASAVAVVTVQNLVRSVLALAVTLLSTAVLFVLLHAPFMAGIQVLLYTGGVITLMLFGVMMTRRQEGVGIESERSLSRRVPAAIFCAVFLGTLVLAILSDVDALGAMAEQSAPVSTEVVGRSFLTEYLLAFEVLSLLLLAAMIGAIVLARRHDHGSPAAKAIRAKGTAARGEAA